MKKQIAGQIDIFGNVEPAVTQQKTEPVGICKEVTTYIVTSIEDYDWVQHEYEAESPRKAAALYRKEHPSGVIKGIRKSSKISVLGLVHKPINF